MKTLRWHLLTLLIGLLLVSSFAACSPDNVASDQPPILEESLAARIKKQVWFTTEIKIPKGKVITDPTIWAVYNGYSYYRADQSYHFVDSLDNPLRHGRWQIDEESKTLSLEEMTNGGVGTKEQRKILSLDNDRFIFTINNALTGGKEYEVRQVAVYNNPDPGLIGELLVQQDWQVINVYRVQEGQADVLLNKEEFPADRYAGVLSFNFNDVSGQAKNRGLFLLTSYPEFGQGTRVIKRGEWEVSVDGKTCYWTLKNAQGDVTGQRTLAILKANGEEFIYQVQEGQHTLKVMHKAIFKEPVTAP